MKKNKITGYVLLIVSILAFLIYGYTLFSTSWGLIVIQITILLLVGIFVVVVAWIGYTMATAPTDA